MVTAGECRDMVCAVLDDLPARDWQPIVSYTADGHRLVGWGYEAVSRSGRPVAVAFDEEASALRLSLAATGLMHRGFEQLWDDVRDLDVVRQQLRVSLEQCLSR